MSPPASDRPTPDSLSALVLSAATQTAEEPKTRLRRRFL